MVKVITVRSNNIQSKLTHLYVPAHKTAQFRAARPSSRSIFYTTPCLPSMTPVRTKRLPLSKKETALVRSPFVAINPLELAPPGD